MALFSECRVKCAQNLVDTADIVREEIYQQLVAPSLRIPLMVARLLYAVTAVATGAQVYWLMAWGIWGAPTSPLQYVSILGSLTLLVAGTRAKWRPRTRAFTAVCAIIAIWCFYGPAVIHTLRQLPSNMGVPEATFAFAPVALLVASTTYAVVIFMRLPRVRPPQIL